MLKLLLGASGSGKTTLLYQRIRARAEAGGRSILLVPEQFTSSTEGRIHRELGDALSGLVESFSFTSLAEHILSAEGGSAVQTLSDAGRAVLVRRALEELQDNVHYYYRHRRSAAFCQMAAETIDELKSAGLSGQRLYALAQECGADSAKLSELALIFQGYETLLAGTGMDPSDRLTLAASRLENALARGGLPEFLRGREVFIDEFDTFNAPKKRLMGALLASLPTVTVALCDDGAPLIPGDMSLFSGAKQVAAQLRQLARRSGTEVAVPELLRRDVRHADAPGLAAAARLLASGQCFLQPGSGQLQPVRGVHAAAGQQGLVALKDEGQLTELTALGSAGTGQLCQLPAGKARALQLVDGLGRHLAEGRTAAVAVVVMHMILQLFQRAAHQHGAARVRKGLHRRAALGGKDLFCQTGKRKTLHHAGQGIPQLTVDAALGAGSELFRHQQDAFFPFFGPGADALVQQRCFSAAGTAQK